MPESATQLPGLVSVAFRPLYKGAPAHRIGATSTKPKFFGRWPT
ncbi:hypothetical protein NB691_003988 [Xanthomonas sacchari]|nr:hypothetical protein [Xanthomonas sacchari]